MIIKSFLQAVGDSPMTEPPLADEGLAAGRDLLGRGRVDHASEDISRTAGFDPQGSRGRFTRLPVNDGHVGGR
jgi:hypothetical protein